MPHSTVPCLLVFDAGQPIDQLMATSADACASGPSGVENHLGWAFRVAASRYSERPAIVTTRGMWSYAQLAAAADRVAAGLRAQPDFAPGVRVLLVIPNSIEYVAAFYGALLAGAVVVPVPPTTEAAMLHGIVASTEARVVITTDRVVQARPELREWSRERVTPPVADCGDPPPFPGPAAVQDLAAIFFTAGSSGTPKGVMLSHANFLANARAIREYLRIGPDDRPLCVLPFPHAFGNSVMQSHLLSGACLILEGQTAFPATLIETLVRRECTSLSGVPDLFRLLLERTPLGGTPLPRLRYMAVAGGALPKPLALEVAERIAPAELFVMYGQTEATARLAFVPPKRLADFPEGAVGQPVPGMTLEVVDEAGRPVVPGEIGELRARGPGVMLGYWRGPAATAERLRDGWLSTGDLAAVENDGTIVLKGRRSALLKVAGFRVHPADLEDFAVRRLPAAQAVAVGFEAPEAGTRLALFVRRGNDGTGLTMSAAMARCRAELPRHMVPDFVRFVEAFPLNAAMKIDRPELVRRAEREAIDRRNAAAAGRREPQ